jgi:hypothetical protein
MSSEDELGERTREIRAAVAGLRSEVDRLHAQLGGVPSEPTDEDQLERPQQPESAPEDGDEAPQAEAPPSASPGEAVREGSDQAGREAPLEEAEPVVESGPESTDQAPETTHQGPETTGQGPGSTDAAESPQAPGADAAEEPEREEPATAGVEAGSAEVVPERLASKSDAELAKTYDLACALLEDAEGRRDQEAIAHWRSLAAAALEESVRRPDFGEAEGTSHRRLGGRRSRRLIAQLESARQLHLERTS